MLLGKNVQRYVISPKTGLQIWYNEIIYATFLNNSEKYSKFVE